MLPSYPTVTTAYDLFFFDLFWSVFHLFLGFSCFRIHSGMRVSFGSFYTLFALLFVFVLIVLFLVLGIATRVLAPVSFGHSHYGPHWDLSFCLHFCLGLRHFIPFWGGSYNVSFLSFVSCTLFLMCYRVQRTPLIPQRSSFSEVGATLFFKGFEFLRLAFLAFSYITRYGGNRLEIHRIGFCLALGCLWLL
jgi:hypothetical protein